MTQLSESLETWAADFAVTSTEKKLIAKSVAAINSAERLAEALESALGVGYDDNGWQDMANDAIAQYRIANE